MITVEHLTKYYGDHLAVDDLSFEIDEGHVYGFLFLSSYAIKTHSGYSRVSKNLSTHIIHFSLYFSFLCSFSYQLFLKTEAKPEDISLVLFLHAVSSDSAWSYYNAKYHFFYSFLFNKINYITETSN